MNLRCTVSSLMLLSLLLFSPSVSIGAEPAAAKPTEDHNLLLIDLFSLFNTLPKEFINLKNNLEDTGKTVRVSAQLEDIHRELQNLEEEVTRAQSMPNLEFYETSSLESRLYSVRARLNTIREVLGAAIEKRKGWYKEWQGKKQQLLTLRQGLGEMPDPSMKETLATFDTLEETVGTATNLLVEQLRTALIFGKQQGELELKTYSLSSKTAKLLQSIRDTGIQQTSPSMLSFKYYTSLDIDLFSKGLENIRIFTSLHLGYLRQELKTVYSILFLLALIAFWIRKSRSLVLETSPWHPFACHPIATSIFLAHSSLRFFSFFLPTRLSLPPAWETLVDIPLILSVASLIGSVCKNQARGRRLRILAIFLAVTLMLKLLNFPQILISQYVFYSSFTGLLLYFVWFVKRGKKEAQNTFARMEWLWGVIPSILLIAVITGYDQLAVYLFSAVLGSVIAFLDIWMFFTIVSVLLETIFLHTPVKLIEQNAAVIIKHLRPVLMLAQWILLLSALLSIWEVFPTMELAWDATTSFGFNLPFLQLDITSGFILTVLLACYLTILVSRAIQAFLCQDLLPRYGVKTGVQVSISRLVHYAILTIGFFIVLNILGFHLSQLTILGGALGVGIGFGLQAIVNNFVSGLILLFEQPLKVGDTIEVGQNIGEVKELGLRATIVKTFDNAEIVIPNSDLITGMVVNWTLSDKEVRAIIPIGVAYGTDISKVLSILQACAEANPRVLSRPKPVALFRAFGASSLDFELRAWVPNYADRLAVISELNQDIENEFHLAGIEIPFPQTDLHIRSMDPAVAVSMRQNQPTNTSASTALK